MMAMEYEAYFYKLSWYTTSILETKYEKVHCFIFGLRLPIRMSTQSLVITDRSFAKVFGHAQVMEEMYCEA